MSAARRERRSSPAALCDLVGFTARAESLEPADVEAEPSSEPRTRLGRRP